MKKLLVLAVVLGLAAPATFAQTTAPARKAKPASKAKTTTSPQAGNPVFPGWYADPEGIIFDKKYWIYPTYSARYEQQVHMDAFSSPDLVTWTKHPRIVDTTAIKWAHKALWAPSVIKKGSKYFLFFSANDVHEGEVGGIGVAVADSPIGPFQRVGRTPQQDPQVATGARHHSVL